MTPSEIHAIADRLGVPWDGDSVFMKWCNSLTGESHLDDMNNSQLLLIAKALLKGDRPGRRVLGFWRFTQPDPKFRPEETPSVTLGNF